MAERGISKETAEAFGVGFFSGRGSRFGRVVIPIHNERGELVAYAGRSIDSSEPKHELPAGFHKSLDLFNLHRTMAKAPTGAGSTVVLVEGFFDCMNVHQGGYPCVAFMGCSMAEMQQDLLHDFCGVVLMLDGDEAGERATDDCLGKLGRSGLWVKAVLLPEGKQPDQLSTDELLQCLASL